MRHGGDARHRLQQLDVLSARPEGVIADDRADGLATELAVFGGIDRLVEPGAGDVRCVFEIFEQGLLRDVQDLDAVVLAERSEERRVGREGGFRSWRYHCN